MERLHQMNVVPDVLPDFRPSFDLRVSFPQYNKELKYGKNMLVEPGVFLEPKDVCSRRSFSSWVLTCPPQTVQKPRLYTTVFHEEPRLYTLLMVDPGTTLLPA
jgi:large subunit ribosomal protein L35